MRLETILLAAGAMLVVTGSPARADDPAAVFKANCAKCHGETGLADTESGKRLKAAVLAGDKKVAGMTVEEIVSAAKENKKHKSFITKLSDEQISAAATYAKELATKK